MSRDTRQRVFETADELLREGIRPTQQLVRERIGSGSLTTINRGLNEWWEALSQRLSQNETSAGVPEPVVRLSTRLWSEAMAYARREHNSLRESLENELEATKEQLLNERSEFSHQLQGLNRTLSEQQQQLADIEQKRQAMQRLLHQAEEECYRLSKSQKVHHDDSISNQSSAELENLLLEERVKLRIKQETIDRLSDKNQKLIEEIAELKLRIKQSQL